MNQKLMPFSALLIISLLAWTSSAIENTNDTIENTNNTNESISLLQNTNLNVEISCNGSGPFKMGDVVNITATFDKPVLFANLMVNDDISSSSDMVNVNDTVWYCEYVIPEGVNGEANVTVLAVDSEENTVEKTETKAFVIDNTIKDNSGDVVSGGVSDLSVDVDNTVENTR